MTAPPREQFKNNGVTTLDGGIDDTQTTLDVANGANFPATGNFRIRIDSELMICTARSGETLTVVRGQEGSVAASHSNGADVTAPMTRDAMYRALIDNIPCIRSSPALNRIVADDGVTILTASDFTWVNQEASAVTDQNGSILLEAATTAANDVRVLARSAPATPYAYIAGFQAMLPRAGATDAVQICMGFRESSSGELQLIQIGTSSDGGPNTLVQNWNSPTSFAANLRAAQSMALQSPVWWLKIEDNGTNLIKYVSDDGSNWIGIESEARTAFMAGGPDQVFWGVRNDANADNTALVRLVHWSRES